MRRITDINAHDVCVGHGVALDVLGYFATDKFISAESINGYECRCVGINVADFLFRNGYIDFYTISTIVAMGCPGMTVSPGRTNFCPIVPLTDAYSLQSLRFFLAISYAACACDSLLLTSTH